MMARARGTAGSGAVMLCRLAVVLVCWLAGPTAVHSQAVPGVLMPAGDYGHALAAALQLAPDEIDYAALRSVYAADPGFTGRSRLTDRTAEEFLNRESAEPSIAWTEDDVMRAIFADFPLLDTQIAAYGHYKTAPLPQENRDRMMGFHSAFYRGIRDSILASERQTDGVRTFAVLSVREEYEILGSLELTSTQQSLLNIEGVYFDRHETTTGPILFDITAFFGK